MSEEPSSPGKSSGLMKAVAIGSLTSFVTGVATKVFDALPSSFAYLLIIVGSTAGVGFFCWKYYFDKYLALEWDALLRRNDDPKSKQELQELERKSDKMQTLGLYGGAALGFVCALITVGVLGLEL